MEWYGIRFVVWNKKTIHTAWFKTPQERESFHTEMSDVIKQWQYLLKGE
jgi:hypothetical protein